jgi:uncharacterized protein with HEPN domain
MLEAIAEIEAFTTGCSFDDFRTNRMMVQAILYDFMIIGEAASSIPEEVRDRHPEISWRQMRLMRNVMVHVYFGVNLVTVWDTVQRNVLPTATLLCRLLEDEAGGAD